MLTTLLSILGGGLGGLLRFVPTILELFKDKADKQHELALLAKQKEIAKVTAKAQAEAQAATQHFKMLTEEMRAYREALAGQSKPTGVRWADALSASVRPVVTYWWMMLFTIYKITTIWQAYAHWIDVQTFLAAVWTNQDAGILSMILGFWFVDRTMKKRGL